MSRPKGKTKVSPAARKTAGVYQPRSRRAALADALGAAREAVARFLRETARRSMGLGFLLLAGAALLALASYDPADPSFSAASARAGQNWLGRPGAFGADLLLQGFGAAALALVLPLAGWGLRLIGGRRVTLLAWRAAASALGAFFLAGALGALPTPGALPAGPGGAVGQTVQAFAAKMSESFDAAILIIAVPAIFAAIGIPLAVLAADLRPGAVLARLQALGRLARGIGRLRVPWPARRTVAPEDNLDAYEEDLGEIEFEDDESEDAAPAERLSFRGLVQREARHKAKARPARTRQPALHLKQGEYQLPPLSVLAEPPRVKDTPRLSDEALEENARLLESVLSDFGVRGRIVAVRPGPVVTLYELEPAAGVKSSRVVSLSDDIARSMSAVAARVAVIPGRNVIGIELPNHTRETVFLRELFAAPEYEKSRAPLTLALGKTIGGESVLADLAKMPHLLIAGTTGSGKSVALNTMILSLLYRMPPDQCRMILIDPKMLELSVYEGIPHLLSPVVVDPRKAVVALKWAVREMENRYGKMAKLGVRGVEAFNERVERAEQKGEELKRTVQTGFDRETGRPVYEDEVLELEPMPYIVVVVDEMADLMMISGKEIEGAVQRLAQMARAAGIHLIAATQRPSVDVITGTIKANFPTRISFQVTSKIDSRTILGEQGAEQLLGQGDMLYMMAGGRIKRIHGPFVTDTEVEEVVRFLKKQGTPEYLESVTEEPDEDGDDPYGLYGGGEGGDDLYDKAVAVVARDRKVSTSYIQRRLQIGYNRAARLIERMEEDGMISKPNHQGKREVLLPEHEGR